MGTRGKFTREQMIVVAVWYHEKEYTHLTITQLQHHFLKRFGTEAPAFQSIVNWEKKLFASRDTDKTVRNVRRQRLNRLIYVPYILESLKRYPDIGIKRRSEILGMNSTTLHNIMREDMKEYLPVKNTVPESTHDDQDNGASQVSKKRKTDTVKKTKTFS